LPETDTSAADFTELFSPVVRYSARTVAIVRAFAARKLLRALADRLGEDDDGSFDFVHVFGGSAWGLGEEIAKILGATLILEIWRPGLISRAQEVARRMKKIDSHEEPVLFAPDPSIEQAATESGALVRLAPWGVHVPDRSGVARINDRTRSVMLVGNARDVKAFSAAFVGLVEATQYEQSTLIFCDAIAATRAGLWSVAKKMGALERLTLIDALETRRDLLLQGDLLVHPDSHGEQRSIVLEAMAAGMVVVAAKDRFFSTLIDGKTALIVDRSDPSAWKAAIAAALTNKSLADSVSAQAAAHMRAHRPASGHIRRVLANYEWIAGRNSIPFPASQSGSKT
jgi:glycosyltransferase involved in cell wall biosynthesis